jgi:hypothetical protein
LIHLDGASSRALPDRAGIRVVRTSFGLLVSAGRITIGHRRLLHYSVSLDDAQLTARAAQRIAKLLGRIHCSTTTRLVKGARSFHILIFLAGHHSQAREIPDLV